MTAADIDDRLVPPLYRIWYLWELGDRTEALRQFQDLLRTTVGVAALSEDRAQAAAFADSFPELLQRILAEPLALQAPPAEVARAVWRQAPRDSILRSIALGDLRWSEDPFETDTADTPAATALSGALSAAESAGLISRDAHDIPFGGRPVLSSELLEVLEPHKLGPVYETLTSAIGGARRENWWPKAGEQLPHFTLRTFMHDAFVKGDGRSGDPVDTWSRISEEHPAYANAVRTAWRRADEIETLDWEDAAQFVARTPLTDLHAVLSRLLRG